jgi:hypothetical protein
VALNLVALGSSTCAASRWCARRDALDAYHGTPLDALVIGSFLLEKP